MSPNSKCHSDISQNQPQPSMDWPQARHCSAPEPGVQSSHFLQALEKHRKLLEDHLEIWQMVEHDARSDSAIRSMAQTCLLNTQSMIKACASMTTEGAGADQTRNETVNENRKHPSEESQGQHATKRAKKAKKDKAGASERVPAAHIHPIKDASGLFTIDPNPTAVNTLLDGFGSASAFKNGKRRRSEQETSQPLGEGAHDDCTRGPATKRVKKEHEMTGEPTSEDVEAYNKSFEAKVELRLKQKEQDRQKKAMKKRKRGSDGTEEFEDNSAVNAGFAEHLHPKQTPSQARKADLKERFEISKPKGAAVTMDDVSQANTKRVRRAVAATARTGKQGELTAHASQKNTRKETDIIDLDEDASEDGGYGKKTSRKKKKPRTRKPKDGLAT